MTSSAPRTANTSASLGITERLRKVAGFEDQNPLKSRLGRRLVLLILLAGLLPLAVFAAGSYFQIRDAYIVRTFETLEGEVDVARGQLQNSIAVSRHRLEELAKNPEAPLPRRFIKFEMFEADSSTALSDEWAGLMTVPGNVLLSRPIVIDSAVTFSMSYVGKDSRTAVAVLNPERFWAPTRSGLFTENDYVLVLDDQNRILASSRPFIPLGSPSPEIFRYLSSEESPGRTNFRFGQSYVVSKPLENSLFDPDRSWKVVVAREAHAQNRLASGYLRSFLIFLGGSLCLLILMAMRFARGILRPVLSLLQSTRDLAAGNWMVKARAAGQDEIGELTRTFNNMTSQLRSAYMNRLRLEEQASIGRLASSVAHEVNNPLAAIKVQLSLMEEKLGEQDREKLRRIHNEIDRISRTLRSLLEFSRTRSQPHERFSPAAVCHTVTALFENLLSAGGIEFRVFVNDDIPELRGNSDQFQQVLVNLLENSRHALKGGGTIELRAWAEGDDVFVTVEDSGPGLGSDPEELFKTFFTTKVSGTGLGLPVARRIIQSMGGTIEGKNKEGGGARFVMKFNLTMNPVEEERMGLNSENDQLSPEDGSKE